MVIMGVVVRGGGTLIGKRRNAFNYMKLFFRIFEIDNRSISNLDHVPSLRFDD